MVLVLPLGVTVMLIEVRVPLTSTDCPRASTMMVADEVMVMSRDNFLVKTVFSIVAVDE